MPSPFLFAILLTYLVYVIGLVTTPSGPAELVGHWYGGFWEFLDINFVNFAVLFVGLLVYQRPAVYRERFGEAASAAAGIILLFPFFAGIQGMMAESGLATGIAEGLLAVSTPETFPIVAWLAASVVNAFVPSGGGEWIVLGPSVLDAAEAHGIP
jgi:short-chain fatty acids transporter